MRAQHGDVIGDGLGVGRADADVDHGDAGVIGSQQVIAGICGSAAAAHPGRQSLPAATFRRVTTLPGSTKAMYSLFGSFINSWPMRTNSSM